MAEASDTRTLEIRFKGMLARIFSDGVVTEEERSELTRAMSSGDLPADRVQQVMIDFLSKTFRHFNADSRITDGERQKLRVIIDELKLPDACVPPEVKRALAPSSDE